MKAFDFRILANGYPAPPLEGFMGGLWWAWDPSWAMAGKIEANVRLYSTYLTLDGQPTSPTNSICRAPLMDTEGLGKVKPNDHKERTRIVREAIKAFGKVSNSKIMLIDYFPGLEGLGLSAYSMQQVELAFSSTTASKTIRNKFMAQAKADVDIVEGCGVVLSNCVVHTEAQTQWFVDKWFTAMANFREAAYSSTEHIAWLCGAYTSPPDTGRELTDNDCQLVLNKVRDLKFSGFALYGSIQHNDRLGYYAVKMLKGA